MQAKDLHGDEDDRRLRGSRGPRIIGRHFGAEHRNRCRSGGKAFRTGFDDSSANGTRGKRIAHGGSGNAGQTIAARDARAERRIAFLHRWFESHALAPLLCGGGHRHNGNSQTALSDPSGVSFRLVQLIVDVLRASVRAAASSGSIAISNCFH
jgi:hypothetical protein